MTLPASGPMSMSQIATELGLVLPLNIRHPWVLALAQVGSGAISLSQLRGKTGRFDGNVTFQNNNPSYAISISPSPISAFFGGTIEHIDNGGSIGACYLYAPVGGPIPNWSGNIRVKNNGTGISVVLTKNPPPTGGNPQTWSVASGASSVIPQGGTSGTQVTVNLSITPA